MGEPTQTMKDLSHRIRDCLKESGLEVTEEGSEHEAVITGRGMREASVLNVVVHIADQERPLVKFGSAVSRLVGSPSLEMVQRPTLEGRSAAGSAQVPRREEGLRTELIPDHLLRLAQLHDAGVLSSEEFEAKKKRLLGES